MKRTVDCPPYMKSPVSGARKGNNMYRSAFELIVHVNGRPVKEYVHNGSTYVEAKKGSRYSLVLKNNTPTRALAIISVDGLDVLKGKPAEETDSGYIVEGYSSVPIKGYRIDDDKVAEFVFDDGKKAYSTSVTKTTKNTGVIGVRFFAEKEKPQQAINQYIYNWPTYVPPIDDDPWYPNKPFKPYKPSPFWCSNQLGDSGMVRSMNLLSIDGQAQAKCSGGGTSGTLGHSGGATSYNMSFSSGGDALASSGQEYQGNLKSSVQPPSAAVPKFDVGTAWGDKVDDRVTKVSFEKGNLITELGIYYATRQALEAVGISFDSRKKVTETTRLPKAFGDTNYCKPPQGWSR